MWLLMWLPESFVNAVRMVTDQWSHRKDGLRTARIEGSPSVTYILRTQQIRSHSAHFLRQLVLIRIIPHPGGAQKPKESDDEFK